MNCGFGAFRAVRLAVGIQSRPRGLDEYRPLPVSALHKLTAYIVIGERSGGGGPAIEECRMERKPPIRTSPAIRDGSRDY
jgi:hypothetical protein